MDFNIRAISMAESVDADLCIPVSDLLGQKIEFRAGISLSVTLPFSPEEFGNLVDAEKILASLNAWARVYRYPGQEGDTIHVVAPAESETDGIVFYRLDLTQPHSLGPGPRPPVVINGGAIMNFEECGTWLIDRAAAFDANPNEAQRHLFLSRPRLPKPTVLRIAWVGPEVVNNKALDPRLKAIGRVCGAEIVRIAPRSFVDVRKKLSGILPLASVVICQRFAPHLTIEVVPEHIGSHLIHVCESSDIQGLEEQIRTWIDIIQQSIANEAECPEDEDEVLLKIMLRGMLSHSKIGPFNHCQKTTLLTGVRARHLNVAFAEDIVDRNTEQFQDSSESDALFLFKDHNDGRQYFLNPKRIGDIKRMLGKS